MNRQSALELIRQNIQKHEFHVYLVDENLSPQYVYTIGLSEKCSFELVLAGASIYTKNEAAIIVDHIARKLIAEPNQISNTILVDDLGSFSLIQVERSWVELMLLGAIDYYQQSIPRCFQIVPDSEHVTVDVPNMVKPRTLADEPGWKWLTEKWEFPVPENSLAITNIEALKGQPVTEAVRWEDNEWELFAGSGTELTEDDVRRVPLCIMLGADSSLIDVTELELGKGIWRDKEELSWHKWEKSNR